MRCHCGFIGNDAYFKGKCPMCPVREGKYVKTYKGRDSAGQRHAMMVDFGSCLPSSPCQHEVKWGGVQGVRSAVQIAAQMKAWKIRVPKHIKDSVDYSNKQQAIYKAEEETRKRKEKERVKAELLARQKKETTEKKVE